MRFEFTPFSLVDSPSSCAIVFCRGCNLQCKYCYNENLFDTKKGLLVEEVIEKLKETQQELNGKIFNTIEWLIISGGEPLCGSSISDIFKIVEVARNLGIKIGMYTNGISVNFQQILPILEFLNLDFKHWNSSFNKQEIKYSIVEPMKMAYKAFQNGTLKYLYLNTVVCNSLHSIDDLKKMKSLLREILGIYPPILEKRSEGNFGWVLTPFFNDFDKLKTLGNMSYSDNMVDIKNLKEKLK